MREVRAFLDGDDRIGKVLFVCFDPAARKQYDAALRDGQSRATMR